jgi:hypothetical protein
MADNKNVIRIEPGVNADWAMPNKSPLRYSLIAGRQLRFSRSCTSRGKRES